MPQDELQVLVVDDLVDVASTLAELLELEGYKVRTASNGKEALALIEESVPECVLIDVNMPVMDGTALARELRSKYSDEMVLICMTGMGDQADRVAEAISLSDHFIRKPVDFEMLRRLLRPR